MNTQADKLAVTELVYIPGLSHELENRMDPIIATVIEHRNDDQRALYVARILVPGRPILVTPEFPSRAVAVTAIVMRWPEAQLVDAGRFEQFRTRRAQGALATA